MTRTYNTGTRLFEIELVERLSKWGVAHVYDTTGGAYATVGITELRTIEASSPNEAFARACDYIDKWLLRTHGI